MYEKFFKRALDILIAVPAIILLTPLFVFFIIWIKLDSSGPVLFSHLRYGRHKKPFRVYKFRSMHIDAPRAVPTNSFADSDSYITRPGRIMRRLSIDELPQLYNVLRGEMSIVGPRPVVLSETKLMSEREKHGAHTVKPGITGWAQVNGRDQLSDVLKAEMDGHYVRNFGFMTDLKCILKTLLIIPTAAGITEGHEQRANKTREVTE